MTVQNPPLFGGLLEKARAGGLPPPPFGGRSVKVTPARAHTKTKFLRENLGVPRATGRPRVTRPSPFQDLKEAYETYGRPRVTRRPRRPKRPKRPRLKRPTGGVRVARGPRVHPMRAVASEALGLTSIQGFK